jgi:hypothetical protein
VTVFSVTVRDHMMIAHSLRGETFGPLAERVLAGAVGESARELDALVVTLHESHIAWASYERPL